MQINSSFSQNLIPIVCLDIGGTLTKLTFATKRGYSLNCKTIEDLKLTNDVDDYEIHFISHQNSMDVLIQTLQDIGFIENDKSFIQCFYVTGGGAFKYHDQLSQFGNIIRINEFDALKYGFKLLDNIKCQNTYFTFDKNIEYLQLTASIYPFILVNIGSGVSILKFDNENEFARISGTSLGGGMFLGLSHLFTGINDFDELLKMTKLGSNAETDLLMDEVHLGFQSPARNRNEKHVAVSMGKLKHNVNKEDIVKSLLYMTTYNISQIAFLHSKLHNVERVFFSGHFIRNHEETLQCINEAFSYFSKLDSQNRHFRYILEWNLIIFIKQQMNSLFSILKDIQITTPQTQLQHTFLVCGQPSTGKSTIISSLTSQKIQESSGLIFTQQKTNIIGYQAILQYFEVSGQAFKKLLTLPLNQQSYQQFSYVLILDLSENPHELLNICNQEIEYIKQEVEKKLQQSIDVETFKKLEQNIYDKILQHHDKNRIRPSFIPITIVGWKYDQFAKNLDQESRKWITRGLRYLAHINNCSLVLGDKTDFQYVKQALNYNVKQSSPIYQYDHLRQICITNLQDSVENINLPPGANNPLDGFNKIIKDQITVPPNSQKKKKQNKITEENWKSYKEEKIDRLIMQYEFQQQNKNKEEQILI